MAAKFLMAVLVALSATVYSSQAQQVDQQRALATLGACVVQNGSLIDQAEALKAQVAALQKQIAESKKDGK